MLKKLAFAAFAASIIGRFKRQAQLKNEKELWREATTAPNATPPKATPPPK